MALVQSNIALGVVTVPQAFTSGAVVGYRASFTIPAGLTVADDDVLELAILPADHVILDATLIAEGNFDGATADIGIMTGEVGEEDDTRTSDDSIFDGAALTGFVRVTANEGLLIDPAETDRSIGVTFSDDVVGAGQVITLQILMTQ